MANDSFSETVEDNSRNVCLRTSARAFVKFLAINIKRFDSEPENCHIFIDSFECAMIKKDTLPAVQKMNCLKNFVEGKPTTIISSIKLANENYNICLNLFKERHDSHFHMSKLLKLENITDVKDVSGLKNLFDTINVQVRSLKHLGYKPDRYGPLLIPIIISKIPDHLNLIISNHYLTLEIGGT